MILFQKKQTFSNTWALSENVLGFWWNKNGKDVKTASRVFRKTLWDKKFFFQKNIILILIADFEWKTSILWQNVSTRVPKLKSTWPVGFFEKNFFGRRYKFVSSYGISEGKLTCKKTPVLSGMLFGCPGEFSEWHFSRRNKTFQTLGLWARMFRFSGETRTAKMSKLHAICSEKHFETKGFFSKRNIILTLFVDFDWTNSKFWQNFPTRVSKLKTTWPPELFEKPFRKL